MAVKLKEFVYNDKPRQLYEMVNTSEQLGGIDVSMMSERDKAAFIQLVADFQEGLEPFMTSYYRRFNPQKIAPQP